MKVLRSIEQRVEGLFERGFRRAFRSGLQPVELARKLAREMEEHKTISVTRVYVPNEYSVFLSEEDRQQFSSYEASLRSELATYLEAHARASGLTLLATPVVSFETDDDLRLGEFGISCRLADPPLEEAAQQSESGQPSTVAAEAVPEPAPTPPPPIPAPAPATPAYRPLAGVSGTQVISPEEARAEGLQAATVTLVSAGVRHRISKRVTTIGRSRDCDLVVPDLNVSRMHAEIRHIGPDYYLVDMGSTNGVEVNGAGVTRHVLADGDVIGLGTSEIRVEIR